MNRLNTLPEDVARLVWRGVFDDCIKELKDYPFIGKSMRRQRKLEYEKKVLEFKLEDVYELDRYGGITYLDYMEQDEIEYYIYKYKNEIKALEQKIFNEICYSNNVLNSRFNDYDDY